MLIRDALRESRRFLDTRIARGRLLQVNPITTPEGVFS
jgi:hypothetical protein